jgi:type II secretory pathway component PulF
LLAKEYSFLATVTNEAKSALTYPVVLIVIALSAVI